MGYTKALVGVLEDNLETVPRAHAYRIEWLQLPLNAPGLLHTVCNLLTAFSLKDSVMWWTRSVPSLKFYKLKYVWATH